MKKLILFSMSALLLVGLSSCNNKRSLVHLNDQNDTISWVVGQSMAQGIMASGMEIDKELVLKAVEAAFDGKEQPIDGKTYNEVLEYINATIAENQRQIHKKQGEEAKAHEAAYFSKLMADNPNVKKSSDGFYYEVVKEGSGRKASMGSVVKFDYKGYLIDGKQFDKTYGNRDPIIHVVGNPMFSGMQMGLCMMNAGSIYRFYFPNEIAFGAKGTPDVPPYTAVIYEIELHEIQ